MRQQSAGYGSVHSQNHVHNEDTKMEDDNIQIESGKVEYKYRTYSLPILRFVNAVRTILFIDGVLAIILWTIGKNIMCINYLNHIQVFFQFRCIYICRSCQFFFIHI